MKTCTKCGVDKPLLEFSKHTCKKDGLRSNCKVCEKAYLVANHEAQLLRQKSWRENNRKAHNDGSSLWRQNNRDKVNAHKAKRRAAKLQATPPWLNKEDLVAIQQLYTIANQLTELNGAVHHVDHIIPLQGKTVCGLHVLWNLRVLEGTENMSKSNRLALPAELVWN